MDNTFTIRDTHHDRECLDLNPSDFVPIRSRIRIVVPQEPLVLCLSASGQPVLLSLREEMSIILELFFVGFLSHNARPDILMGRL